MCRSLKNAVRSAIGPIATPDFIIYSDLPKTRSGEYLLHYHTAYYTYKPLCT